MLRVDGKTVFIAGGNGGIGAAAAVALAAQGALVTIADLDAAAVARTASEIGVEAATLDVTQEAQWKSALEVFAERHGRLDVLVNAAGIEGDLRQGTPESTALEEWRRVFAVNADGTFLGCKCALSIMRRAARGAIINISSIVSGMGTPGSCAYGASKAAIEQLSRSVAAYGARDGGEIRCNSVHPGRIETRMLRSIRTQLSSTENQPSARHDEPAGAEVPLRRVGDPSEVGNLIVYLASDESRYVTGSRFEIDGGWHIGGPR